MVQTRALLKANPLFSKVLNINKTRTHTALSEESGEVGSNDGSVESSGPSSDSSSCCISMTEVESSSAESNEDCDINETLDMVESDRDNVVDDSVLNDERLVGVAMSSPEDKDGGRGGTGVSGGSGESGGAEDTREGDCGIVLNRFTDDAEPLGLRIEVSNEVSGPS